jgi:hypothetical protein
MKKQKKEISLPMEWNYWSGVLEPVLPLKKTNKKLKLKVNWKKLILYLLGIILVTAVYLWIISKI